MKKLSTFRKTRERNFAHLLRFMKKFEKFFILPIQEKEVRTQWLAFPLTVRSTAPFTRIELMKFLEENNVQTRPIFTGNILRQPGFKNILHKGLSSFPITDGVMKGGMLVGCHHGMETKHLERLESLFSEFLQKFG